MSEPPQDPAGTRIEHDASQLRYFDGVVWSSHTTPRRSPTIDESVGIGRGSPPRAWSRVGRTRAPGAAGSRASPASRGSRGRARVSGRASVRRRPGTDGGGPLRGLRHGLRPRRDVLPDGAVLAEWWRRLLARILDSIITTVLAPHRLSIPGWAGDVHGPVGLPRTPPSRQGSRVAPADQSAYVSEMLAASLPITIITWSWGLLYETTFLVWRGATPGKMMLGTVVRRVGSAGTLTLLMRSSGSSSGLGTAVLGFLPLVGLLGSFISVLDPAWLLWDPKRQALHDKVADTVVVLRDPPA